MRLGIPAYRLPRDILDRSIKMILDLGIETRTGFHLGEKDTWKTLDSFDAVFLALGAHDPMLPSISGSDHPGVISGLDFLKEVNMDRRNEVENPVAVMGGGNTAIDAARVCRRLGAEVTIIYRRSRQEMPASDEGSKSPESWGVAPPVKKKLSVHDGSNSNDWVEPAGSVTLSTMIDPSWVLV